MFGSAVTQYLLVWAFSITSRETNVDISAWNVMLRILLHLFILSIDVNYLCASEVLNNRCLLWIKNVCYMWGFYLCDLNRSNSNKMFHRGLWRELSGFLTLAVPWHHICTLCGLLKNLGMCGWVWRKCQRSGFPFIRSAVMDLQSHMVQHNL